LTVPCDAANVPGYGGAVIDDILAGIFGEVVLGRLGGSRCALFVARIVFGP
jgi:hypothetical protein